MAQASAVYSTKNWDRKAWGSDAIASDSSVRLGRIEMTHTFEGDIEGEGTLQYLFAHNKDSTGGFVGLEKVTGTIHGKSGSFVLQYIGTAINDRLQQTLIVVPGSGTGELTGLRGQATMDCDLHLDRYALILEYSI
jgi:hypothetical protein